MQFSLPKPPVFRPAKLKLSAGRDSQRALRGTCFHSMGFAQVSEGFQYREFLQRHGIKSITPDLHTPLISHLRQFISKYSLSKARDYDDIEQEAEEAFKEISELSLNLDADWDPMALHTGTLELFTQATELPTFQDPLKSDQKETKLADPRGVLRKNDPTRFDGPNLTAFLKKISDSRTVFQDRVKWKNARMKFINDTLNEDPSFLLKHSSSPLASATSNPLEHAEEVLGESSIGFRLPSHFGYDAATTRVDLENLPNNASSSAPTTAITVSNENGQGTSAYVKKPSVLSSMSNLLETSAALQSDSSSRIYSALNQDFVSEVFSSNWDNKFSTPKEIQGLPQTEARLYHSKRAHFNKFKFDLLTNASSIELEKKHNNEQQSLANAFQSLEQYLSSVIEHLTKILDSLEPGSAQEFTSTYTGPGRKLLRRIVKSISDVKVTPSDLKLHLAETYKLKYNIDILDDLRDNQRLINGVSLQNHLENFCKKLNDPLLQNDFSTAKRSMMKEKLEPFYQKARETKLILALSHKAPSDAPTASFPLFYIASAYNRALKELVEKPTQEKGSLSSFSLFPRLASIDLSNPYSDPTIPLSLGADVDHQLSQVALEKSTRPDPKKYQDLVARIGDIKKKIANPLNRDPEVITHSRTIQRHQFSKISDISNTWKSPIIESKAKYPVIQIFETLYSALPPLVANSLSLIIKSKIFSLESRVSLSEIYSTLALDTDSSGRIMISVDGNNCFLGSNGFFYNSEGNQIGFSITQDDSKSKSLDINGFEDLSSTSFTYVDADTFKETAPEFSNLNVLSSQLNNRLGLQLAALTEKDTESRKRIEALLNTSNSATKIDRKAAKDIFESSTKDIETAYSPFGPTWAAPNSSSLHLGNIETASGPEEVRSLPTTLPPQTSYSVLPVSHPIDRQEFAISSMLGENDTEFLNPKSRNDPSRQIDHLNNGLSPYFASPDPNIDEESLIELQEKIESLSDKSWVFNTSVSETSNQMTSSDLKEKIKLETFLYESYLKDPLQDSVPMISLPHAHKLVLSGANPLSLFTAQDPLTKNHRKKSDSSWNSNVTDLESFIPEYKPYDSTRSFLLKQLLLAKNRSPLTLAMATFQKAVDINSQTWKESTAHDIASGVNLPTQELVHSQHLSLQGLSRRELKALEWNSEADYDLSPDSPIRSSDMFSDPDFLTQFSREIEDLRLFETLKACFDVSEELKAEADQKHMPRIDPDKISPEILDHISNLQEHDPALLALFFDWLEQPRGITPEWASFLRIEREWYFNAFQRLIGNPEMTFDSQLTKMIQILVWFVDAAGGPRFCDPTLRLAAAQTWATYSRSFLKHPKLISGTMDLGESGLEKIENSQLTPEDLIIASQPSILDNEQEPTIQVVNQLSKAGNSQDLIKSILSSCFPEGFDDHERFNEPALPPSKHNRRLTPEQATLSVFHRNIRHPKPDVKEVFTSAPENPDAPKFENPRGRNIRFKFKESESSEVVRNQMLPHATPHPIKKIISSLTGVSPNSYLRTDSYFESPYPRLYSRDTSIRNELAPYPIRNLDSFQRFTNPTVDLPAVAASIARQHSDPRVQPLIELEQEDTATSSTVRGALNKTYQALDDSHYLNSVLFESLDLSLKEYLYSVDGKEDLTPEENRELINEYSQKVVTEAPLKYASPLQAQVKNAADLSGVYQKLKSITDDRPTKGTSMLFNDLIPRDYSNLSIETSDIPIQTEIQYEEAKLKKLDTESIHANSLEFARPGLPSVSSIVTDELDERDRFNKVTPEPITDAMKWTNPSIVNLQRQSAVRQERSSVIEKLVSQEDSNLEETIPFSDPLGEFESHDLDPLSSVPARVHSHVDPFAGFSSDQISNLDPELVKFIKNEGLY